MRLAILVCDVSSLRLLQRDAARAQSCVHTIEKREIRLSSEWMISLNTRPKFHVRLRKDFIGNANAEQV